jgi:predicted outer membrane repeat protein
LTLKKVTLAGGRADNGGAILTGGPLIVEDSILSGNQVTGSGGAIFGGAFQIVLRRAQLSNNTATTFGGAVSAGNGGVLVVDTTISDNTASSADGGGIISNGPTRIYRSVIKNNHAMNSFGGGVACEATATLEIHESTISGNSAFVGGGIYATYPVLIDRSTLSGNTANSSGGGLVFANGTYGVGSALVSSSTLYLNTAGIGSAIYFIDGKQDLPVPVLTNTVISGTCTGSARSFLAPTGNVESPGNTCNVDVNHDVSAVNLKLGALGDNGGPTPTHLPLAGSAVLAVGQNCPSYDQRGYGLVSTAVCDSGSVSASAVNDAVFRDGFAF